LNIWKDVYDPQNEGYLNNLGKVRGNLNRPSQRKESKDSSDSDEMNHMEEDISENETTMGEASVNILDQVTMLEKASLREEDEASNELGFIPRIYAKNFKKIKCGLRKVLNDIGVLFKELNMNKIYGFNDTEKLYIQAVFKRMTFLLKQHIFEKIGKKKDAMEKRLQHGNKWKNRRPRNGINDEALEEYKREKLAEWDRKEGVLV
jgi:hypothetical protein